MLKVLWWLFFLHAYNAQTLHTLNNIEINPYVLSASKDFLPHACKKYVNNETFDQNTVLVYIFNICIPNFQNKINF